MKHRNLAQRIDNLAARSPDHDPPELRRLFWSMRSTMGLPQNIADRALRLAEQCAPLPTTWPPRELCGAPVGAP